MKIQISRSTIGQVAFAALFNLLFFLPYLGGTHFRVDQLIGVLLWPGWHLGHPLSDSYVGRTSRLMQMEFCHFYMGCDCRICNYGQDDRYVAVGELV